MAGAAGVASCLAGATGAASCLAGVAGAATGAGVVAAFFGSSFGAETGSAYFFSLVVLYAGAAPPSGTCGSNSFDSFQPGGASIGVL